MVNDRVFDAIAPKTAEVGVFGHGYTYSGHPVPAAVALETLKIYEEADLIAEVKARSRAFLDRLHGFADRPLVGETMGLGLVGAVELVADKGTKAPFEPAGTVAPWLAARAQKHGLIVRAMGDRVAFSPPLIISDAEIDADVRQVCGRAVGNRRCRSGRGVHRELIPIRAFARDISAQTAEHGMKTAPDVFAFGASFTIV